MNMNELKPIASLVYLYYKCSKCGEQGDEVRAEVAKQPVAYHTCPYCDHIDKIATIKKIKPQYHNQNNQKVFKELPSHNIVIPIEWIDNTKKRLVAIGYGSREADDLIKQTSSKITPTSKDHLFKECIIQGE